jgi:hypothetical protein
MNAKDWFRDQKWGIFTHFLNHEQNTHGTITNMGIGETSWDECVNGFDVERFAGDLSQTGAGYLMFTLQQGERFMAAPNETFNRITGCKTGEACASRDLIADLIKALDKVHISLFLYFTGDGPYKDPVAGPSMGYARQHDPLTGTFLRNWSSVAREYSLRYGEKIKGWWVDGCYESFHYTDESIKYYTEAMKAGNPHALTAFNNGVKDRISYYSIYDDYTCGEMNSFVDIPDSRFIHDSQWHILAPLGIPPDGNPWGGWCKPGCKHSLTYMKDYMGKVNSKGGVVTIDVALYRDGHIDPEQLELLKSI